jgi:aminoglycoside phosphotransferase (APT) family kinase protein
VGQATDDFPWPWSIYNWIEGDVVTQATEKVRLAQDVARFINSLQMINPAKGPPPGEHNFFRGAHPIEAWGEDAQTHIDKLGDLVDVSAARAILDEAAVSDFGTPVWVHGDVAISNFLTRDGRLSAVLDFGGLSVGDPSCDLVLAWVFFENESREAFRSLVHADGGTWARARAWALWKAARLAVYAQVVNPFELKPLQVISAVIEDHRQSS